MRLEEHMVNITSAHLIWDTCTAHGDLEAVATMDAILVETGGNHSIFFNFLGVDANVSPPAGTTPTADLLDMPGLVGDDGEVEFLTGRLLTRSCIDASSRASRFQSNLGKLPMLGNNRQGNRPSSISKRARISSKVCTPSCCSLNKNKRKPS